MQIFDYKNHPIDRLDGGPFKYRNPPCLLNLVPSESQTHSLTPSLQFRLCHFAMYI